MQACKVWQRVMHWAKDT